MVKSQRTKLIYKGHIFSIESLVTASGSSPAKNFLQSLPHKAQQKFAALFKYFGDTGSIRNEKKFKHLTNTDGIFEFKINGYRVLSFFFLGKRVILTHGFQKKQNKTPKKEIKKSEILKKYFQ